MAITYPIAAPAQPSPRSFALEFVPATAAHVSIYTDAVQTYEHDRLVWRAAVTLPPLLNATSARTWHGFLVALNGLAGTFTMSPPQHASPQGTQAANVLVRSAAAIRAKTLAVKTMTAGSTLLAGDLISVANRLYMVTEDATADGSGNADISLSHGLREAASVDATVRVNAPVGTWRLADPAALRNIQPGGISGITFGAVEAV